MADAPGDDVAVLLLRVLPAEVAELILGQLDEATAGRLRTRLRAAPVEPPAGNAVDAALREFFDLQRIAGRTPPVVTQADAKPGPGPEAATPADPVEAVRTIAPDLVARALDGEQPGAVALVLSCLEPSAAGAVLKRIPGDLRAEVALRMTKLGVRNEALLQKLVRAVVEKAKRLGELPPQPTEEELITNLADMLRAMPRAERMPVLQKMEAADPELFAKILEKLYRIEDLLRIPDRQVQSLLGKLDVKSIAVALSGVATNVRDKVSSNMSSRARTALAEESELLGKVPTTRIKEAQGKVMLLIKKGEEDGEVTMEE